MPKNEKIVKKGTFWNRRNSSECHVIPFFISYSERGWVVDSISCIILGDLMLWRNHIAIWSKKIEFWFLHYIWQCCSDCISVVWNRFSPKFQYVVAETVLYKVYDIYFWFRWWDHGENFDWRWEVRIGHRLFQIYVLCVDVPWYIGVDTRLSGLWPGFESAEGFFFLAI